MLHILICDDEPAFGHSLKCAIEALPDYNRRSMLISCVTDPNSISHATLRESDIVFLDIDMGEINGLDFAKKLRAVRRDSVLIFVTNYGEYAAEGYEVQAFRFLSKLKLEEKLPGYFRQALEELQRRTRIITVFCGGEEIPVHLDDLMYVKKENRCLQLHFVRPEKSPLMIRGTLRALEGRLQEDGFLRVHNSHLVNMRFVKSLQAKGVLLTNQEILPISQHSYKKLKMKYLEWKASVWYIY